MEVKRPTFTVPSDAPGVVRDLRDFLFKLTRGGDQVFERELADRAGKFRAPLRGNRKVAPEEGQNESQAPAPAGKSS